MRIDASHLSKETRYAIDLFKAHHPKQFYTQRMLDLEAEAINNVPDSELAEFVRITTLINDEG